jgi:hypothetical protein
MILVYENMLIISLDVADYIVKYFLRSDKFFIPFAF